MRVTVPMEKQGTALAWACVGLSMKYLGVLDSTNSVIAQVWSYVMWTKFGLPYFVGDNFIFEMNESFEVMCVATFAESSDVP